ncbi:Detected protein of confused Function [Hibiscus syriacus]|uniref:Detected protein of confused Function n=1 Tax=Hibiscus syriacus TaxID=106335 RepID=A0A6A2Y1E7_HIBSY|nr:Detected protein of confused Function [Hibiscus syriacus]
MISLVSLISFTLLFIHGGSTQPPFSCDSSNPEIKNLLFCQTGLPITQRARDLVSRLTLDEKISQLVNSAPAIPRMGILAYEWWLEALHGIANVGPGVKFDGTIKAATSFPQVILTAASFDPYQWYRIELAIGREARAMYNAGEANGMTFWAPNINIFRDPSWGRGQETPGEDPLVVGKYAGMNRFVFDARVSLRQNSNLLLKTVRGEWDFKGYIASDCDAVALIHDDHGYAKAPEDAVVDVLKAGMDVNCGSYLQNNTKSAVLQKKLPESQIDRALHNLFSVRMRLGLFDGNPEQLPFSNIGTDQICSPEHQILALEAACNGIVLLKNDATLLPLPKSTMLLAVIGPNADSPQTLIGNYAGPPCKSVAPLQALKSYVNTTVYHPGCDMIKLKKEAFDRVDLFLPGRQHELIIGVAKSTKRPIVLVLLSGGPIDVSFTKDDPRIGGILWAGYRGEGGGIALAEIIFRDHNPGGRLPVTWYPQDFTDVSFTKDDPRIGGILWADCFSTSFRGPIDVSFTKDDPRIGGILWAGYRGKVEVLHLRKYLRDHNPGGRLPVTWYPQDFTKVPMTDMRMRPEPSSDYPGRTYKFYKGDKVFEFGYGLSHSKVTSDSVRYKLVSELSAEVCGERKFTVHVGVKNHGDLAGEMGEIQFEVNPCEHLSRANEYGLMVMEEGTHFLLVGDDNHPITLII